MKEYGTILHGGKLIMNNLKITSLVDNIAAGSCLGEHGLCMFIEYNDKKIIFDTGQGNAIQYNAEHLSIDLETADAIVLSHGHYDHTGGMYKIKQINKIPIFTHRDSLLPKYSRHPDGSIHKIGMKSLDSSSLNFKFNDKPIEIYKGFHLTGPIPRMTNFEDTGGQFFSDEECRKVDNLIDDQAVFIETAAGLVVVLGCAHSGVVNTLQYISKLSGSRSIHTLIGGMHLRYATKNRINKTITELKKFNIQNIYPAHCSGLHATAQLCHELPKICKAYRVGTIIEV